MESLPRRFGNPPFISRLFFPNEINRLSNSFEYSAGNICSRLRGNAKHEKFRLSLLGTKAKYFLSK